MPGNYSHTTRATGTVLTATIYNTDHQNHIDNQTPAGTDDYSASVAQMQSVVDPGTVGAESFATSTAGELERIRFVIKRALGGAQWYSNAANIPNFNYTFNGSLQIWGAGTASAPTGWVLAGAGATIAKNTTPGQFRFGTASAQITRVGTDAVLQQIITDISDFGPASAWGSKTITLGAWVYATVASRARIRVDDGTNTAFSSYHSGVAGLEFLTATLATQTTPTQVAIRLQVDTGNTSASFDGVILVVGNAVSDFIPSGWRGRKAIITTSTTPGTNVAAGTTVFLGTAGHATGNQRTFLVPFKGIARRLYLRADSSPGVGQTYIYTLRDIDGGGVDKALTGTTSGTNQLSSDTTNEVELATGTGIAIKLVTSATAAVHDSHSAVMEYEEIP